MKIRRILSLILAAVMLFGCMTVTAFAEDNGVYLDLETGDTYSDTKDIEQNYTFTQSSEEYTDVTKVKLEWTINDIAANYKSHKTWDADKLTWVEAKEDVNVTNEGATFTLTNYSSVAVIAKAEFAVETSLADTFTEATFTNNGCTVTTPVVKNSTTYKESDFTAKSQTITASLTLNTTKFADLSATASAAKYGTYTVTIKEYSFGPQYKYEINQLAEYMNMDGNHLQRLLLDWTSNASNRNITYSDILSDIETKDDALCASAIYILGIEHFIVTDSAVLNVSGKEFSKGFLPSDVLFKKINTLFNLTNTSNVPDSTFINDLPSSVLSPMNEEFKKVNSNVDIPVCDIYDAFIYSIEHAEEESPVGNTYTLTANAIYKLLNIYSTSDMSLDDVKASMDRMIAKAENKTILGDQVFNTFMNETDEIKQQTAYDYAIYCYMCMFGLMSGDPAYTALSGYFTEKEFTSLEAIGYVLGDDYLFKKMAQIHEVLQTGNIENIMYTSYSQLSGSLISGIYTNYTDDYSDMYKAIAEIFKD